MTLEEAIKEAQEFLDNPPINESTTCDWVIRPLLVRIGYSHRDIESRVADNGGQFPDYTILPNEPASTWYLEAKDWKIRLEDSHAKQALNYANHNGKRYVVLTNGREWRLYDNIIQGVVSEKHIALAALKNTDAMKLFLTMISRAEVIAGGLHRFDLEASDRLETLRRENVPGDDVLAALTEEILPLPSVPNPPGSRTGNPGVARVKGFVINSYVTPARQQGDTHITLVALAVHKALRMSNAMPTVCNALDSVEFHRRAGIRLIERRGPKLSSTVTWRFELV